MRILASLLLLCGLLLGTGCQSGPGAAEATPQLPPSAVAEATSTLGPLSPPQEDTQMTPPAPTPSDPALQGLIDKAIADLARRLSIPATQIELVDAIPVVWPNASLGCPQKGMVYAEVLTPGYLIMISAENHEYEYHASTGTEVIYCVNPTPPVPGTPGDISEDT